MPPFLAPSEYTPLWRAHGESSPRPPSIISKLDGAIHGDDDLARRRTTQVAVGRTSDRSNARERENVCACVCVNGSSSFLPKSAKIHFRSTADACVKVYATYARENYAYICMCVNARARARVIVTRTNGALHLRIYVPLSGRHNPAPDYRLARLIPSVPFTTGFSDRPRISAQSRLIFD